ncbi:MAG: DUF6497 family protein [Pseudomonadota bacterium]
MTTAVSPSSAPARHTAVPSGQPVVLYEVLVDRVGQEDWVRFRFLAPRISRVSGDLSFSDVEADFMHLCSSVALQYIEEFDLAADVIIVAMSDREVDFGTSDPDATQFIEAFRLARDGCVWEAL